MRRVVGCDPGTSSLDLVLFVNGAVADQARLTPDELRDDPGRPLSILRGWAPLDLIAGPSGYGLPLVHARDATEADLDAMILVRPDERGFDLGVAGFRGRLRALVESGLPIVFLPGGIHLPTIPRHRKANAIDLGTADKVAVAALALRRDLEGHALDASTFAVAEIGSAFSAILVVERGRLVDASAGTRGPIGLRSGGAWDGEVAYRAGPLSKADLFRGGLADLGVDGPLAFRESLTKAAAGLRAVTPFERIYVSGAGSDRPEVAAALAPIAELITLPNLPGAWVKHAAQGAALVADGLAGGPNADLVAVLELGGASGHAWDHIQIGRPTAP